MSDDIEIEKNVEQDWASDAELAANRARMYAELSKRNAHATAALQRQSRRLLRLAILVLLAVLTAHLLSLLFSLTHYWSM